MTDVVAERGGRAAHAARRSDLHARERLWSAIGSSGRATRRSVVRSSSRTKIAHAPPRSASITSASVPRTSSSAPPRAKSSSTCFWPASRACVRCRFWKSAARSSAALTMGPSTSASSAMSWPKPWRRCV
jgi:hypothetical protein